MATITAEKPKITVNDTILSSLERIRKGNNGILLPEDVVKNARSVKSPLHSHFQWDDSIAGEEYRIWQARQLIKVAVTIIPNFDKPIRAYVSLREDRPEGGYRLLVEVLANVDLKEQLLNQALKDYEYWENRYHELKELAPIFQAAEYVKKNGHKTR